MSRLQALYDSEINGSIEWYWDGGFRWALGDPVNGFETSGFSPSFEEAAKDLWNAAKSVYPDAKCFLKLLG
jgi:hypothetical protein